MSEERSEHEISQNQQRTLQAISQIDDKIIDKNTGKRIVLLAAAHRRAKKRWTAIISVAASLALILTSLLIMIPVLAKQVPIYTGMTVSGAAPVMLESGMLPTYFAPGTPNGNANGNKHVSGDHTGADKTIGDQPFDTPIGDAVGALTVEGAGGRYYTVPNADVYITVHIKNPDQFEILSFTLNGKKYQSNMFEYGSDLENIILKVNVGDVEGVVSYTIDAIKYVDGTDIKDVRMDGEKTVEIGVYTEKQPTALFSATMASFDMMTFTVDLSDTMNLFASLSGDVEAVLFDGSSIVARKTLAPTGKTTVIFNGLTPGKLYEYAVIASYDALDGKGVVRHVIASDAMHTRSYLLFDNVTVGTKRVSYTFHWDADATGGAVRAVALYQNGEKLRDVEPTATEITGLSVGTTYVLVATYQREGRDEQISITFTTEKLIVTVNQYLENLDGTYALVDTKSEEVAEGTTYTPLLGGHVGFTTPTVLPVTLTDSSYTFECRFDRTVYSVTFVDNNGVITSERLKFGAPLAPQNAPVRDGFTLGGWYVDVNLTTPAAETVSTGPVTVYAKWLLEARPQDITYTLQNGEITVTGIQNIGIADLVIPAYIAGCPVTQIAANAFSGITTLQTVELPKTLKHIGSCAFMGLGLTRIHIPASVTKIEQTAFKNCNALVEITVATENDVYFAVGNCLIERAGKTMVLGIATATLPDDGSVVAIAPHALDMQLIREFYIPAAVLEVGAQTSDISFTFAVTKGWVYLALAEKVIDVTDHNAVRTAMSSSYALKRYEETYFRFLNDETVKITSLPVGTTRFVIPETIAARRVSAIASGAFQNERALLEITIPTCVSAIGEGAFDGCTALSLATLSADLLVHLPVASMTQIVLSAGEKIPAHVLDGSKNLTVVVCDSVTYIGKQPMSENPMLQFANSKGWVAVLDGEECAIDVTDSGNILTAMNGSYALKRYEETYFRFLENNTVEITGLPDGTTDALVIPARIADRPVTAIAKNAFAKQTALTSVVMPATLTLIGTDAFLGCAGLAKVVISDLAAWCDIAFENIGANPLHRAHHLYLGETLVTKLVIPESVTAIGARAFLGAVDVTEIVIHAGATTIGVDAFSGCSITVATMPTTAISAVSKSELTHLTLNGGGTVPSSFVGAYNKNLQSLTIGGGITVLEEEAFSSCENLTDVTFTEDCVLEALGRYSFGDCDSLRRIEIPASVKVIGEYAFVNCPLEEGMTFAEGSVLESIEEGAFQYADMTSVHFPASLKTIGRWAFEVCSNLEIVTFAEGSVLERVGRAAFSRCGSVAIHLPASVTEIGLGAEHTMNLVFAETEGWVSVHWDTGVESPIDVTKLDELDGNFQDWHSLKRYPTA